MELIDRLRKAVELGYIYDKETGYIYNRFNKLINRKHSAGYISFRISDGIKRYTISGHQFAWYIINNCIVDCIDHINGIKDDNRIDNLRSVTIQHNNWNRTKCKGYTKRGNRYLPAIKINKKTIYLGSFSNEEDARKAYLNAKKVYHTIL
jgi:hypothetical protein